MPTVFKFQYHSPLGYACSHPGDNTGYYVNLNDYERLQLAGRENAPDKLLRCAELIQIIDKEEDWSKAHTDEFTGSQEYISGFLAGLRQAKHLITKLVDLNENDSFPISAPWGEPLDYDLDDTTID
jgi:hypothetical protein